MKLHALARSVVSGVVMATVVVTAPAFAQSQIIVPGSGSTSLPVKAAPPSLVALSRAAETPEGMTKRYFQALQQRGVSASADFLHPDEIGKFKALLLPVFQAEAKIKKSDLRQMVFGNASLEMIEKTDPTEFTRRMLTAPVFAKALGNLQFRRLDVIGSISEVPDLVHVVVRTEVALGELTVTAMDVVTLRPHEGQWKMVMDGEMQGLAQGLQALVERMKP